MIIRYGTSKFTKNNPFYFTGYSANSFGGTATLTTIYPPIPRLPMFPNQEMERTWIEYFRSIHNILSDHLSDYQMHKVK